MLRAPVSHTRRPSAPLSLGRKLKWISQLGPRISSSVLLDTIQAQTNTPQTTPRGSVQVLTSPDSSLSCHIQSTSQPHCCQPDPRTHSYLRSSPITVGSTWGHLRSGLLAPALVPSFPKAASAFGSLLLKSLQQPHSA